MRSSFLVIIVWLLVPVCSSAGPLAHEKKGEFWVHGRLRAYCGGPGWRIWVVGTTRVLGVSEDGQPALDQGCMPYELYALALSQRDVTGTDIFGDFLVRPLQKDAPGKR